MVSAPCILPERVYGFLGRQDMGCGAGQCIIRRWLAQIGREIAHQPFQRMGFRETRQPDRALRQFQHVEASPFHRAPCEIDVGHHTIRRDPVGDRELGCSLHEQARGLRRGGGSAEAGRLMGIGAPAGGAQMRPVDLQNRFDSTELDRQEPPAKNG